MKTRRAYIKVTYSLLHQLLHLPDDVHIDLVENARDFCSQALHADTLDIYLTSDTNTQIPITAEGAVCQQLEMTLEFKPSTYHAHFR